MGSLRSKHRPLRGGIGIIRSSDSGHYGTLTAVARRKIGDEKVLVTNRHVVSHGGNSPYDIQGSESVYQWEVNDTDKVGTLYIQNNKNSWLPVSPTNDYSIDLAALLVEDGVLTDFGVHEHGTSNAVHRKRPIVQPVKEPERDLPLTFLGAQSDKGEVSVSVTPTNFRYDIVRDSGTTTYTFNNCVYLDRRNHRAENGDSGAPVLWEDEDGNYHLCCINFSAGIDSRGSVDRDWGYAIPAKYAEDVLGVTFGVKAPTAVASAPETVHPGQWVALDGEGSRSNEPGGDPLTYQWVWVPNPSPTAIPMPSALPTLPIYYPEQSTPTRNTAAPNFAGTYYYKLLVTDSHGAKAHDRVEVLVVNRSPKAKAGYTQAVPVNAMVTLAGGASDMDIGHVADMEFLWSQKSGTLVTLATPIVNGAAVATNRTFTPTAVGDYGFKLRVTDPGDLFAEDEMTVHCYPAIGTSHWFDTGQIQGCGPTKEKRQTRVHNGETEYQWLSDPEPEPTLPPTQEAPPTPSSSQWDVRYSNNKIQVKVTSLPTVNPAISEVRAYLEAGQPPNLTTVSKAIGTSLNSWVTVLSSSDTQWQTGSWAVHIRFENSVGNSAYSTGKSATVPTPVSPPRPRPTPEIWGPWTDTGVREEDDTDVPRIIWKEQQRTSNRGNTETRWVRA